MEYRVDLYAADGGYDRTERFYARDEVEAITTARTLLAGHGLDAARVYRTDGQGGAALVAQVEGDR